MPERSAKDRLVDLLDRQAFEPVLRTSEDDYDSEFERARLQEVKGATQRERDRYHNDYSSAQEVISNFRDDLDSEEAREVQRKLRSLGLPTLRDSESEFDQLARDLGMDRG